MVESSKNVVIFLMQEMNTFKVLKQSGFILLCIVLCVFKKQCCSRWSFYLYSLCSGNTLVMFLYYFFQNQKVCWIKVLGQRKRVSWKRERGWKADSGVFFMCTFENFLLNLLKNSSSGCFCYYVFYFWKLIINVRLLSNFTSKNSIINLNWGFFSLRWHCITSVWDTYK